MPRKKKKRRQAARFAIAPWVVLAGSLAIIGFACSRTPQTLQPAVTTHHPVARATQTAATVNSPATPAANPITAEPTAPLPTLTGAKRSAASATPAPQATLAPAASATSALSANPAPENSAAPTPPGSARLALIIDDCGQWLDTERGFIALPVTLTLSVLPDVRFNHLIEHEAVEGNKGVMLHLPMETLSGLNPGPGKVTTEMGDGAIGAQVEHDLDDVDLARGVNNHEGSKATANTRVMNDVMTVLARRRRFFIDSRTNSASVAEHVATLSGVATAGRDVFLDNRADVDYTKAQLREAVAIAKRDGSAIAIGHPRATTLAAVRAMIPELQAEGITFVLAADLTR